MGRNLRADYRKREDEMTKISYNISLMLRRVKYVGKGHKPLFYFSLNGRYRNQIYFIENL
jgi:hypothetical protein